MDALFFSNLLKTNGFKLEAIWRWKIMSSFYGLACKASLLHVACGRTKLLLSLSQALMDYWKKSNFDFLVKESF